MKFCIIIPCFDHSATVASVARAALAYGPVFVVDDGSTAPLPELPGCTVLRLERNGGKGSALRAGFQQAADLGFTHAITMDADGQHFTEDLPKFVAASTAQPGALAVGVRDFFASGAPAGRRRSNSFSTFGFRLASGVRLGDTQCGFRCYPLAVARTVRTRSVRYAYELEFMVRAAWMGVPIVAVPVLCSYRPEQVRLSHFRPVVDFARIACVNFGLLLQSWFVPRILRAAWSAGQKVAFREIVRDFFTDHAEDPQRMAMAVGLGLFCGIAPIWGFQTMAALLLAHLFSLNKPIALVACNISIPPMMPLILYGALVIGHLVFTGYGLDYSAQELTPVPAHFSVGEWLVGSVILATLVALVGMLAASIMARLIRQR